MSKVAKLEYSAAAVPEGTLWLRVMDDSMVRRGGEFSFPPDSTIVVDLTAKAMPGDPIVVALANEGRIVRRLASDGEQYFLEPLNPRYPTVPMPDDAKILGVVVEVHVRTNYVPGSGPWSVA